MGDNRCRGGQFPTYNKAPNVARFAVGAKATSHNWMHCRPILIPSSEMHNSLRDSNRVLLSASSCDETDTLTWRLIRMYTRVLFQNVLLCVAGHKNHSPSLSCDGRHPSGSCSIGAKSGTGSTLVRLKAVSACGGPNEVSHRNGRSSTVQILNLISSCVYFLDAKAHYQVSVRAWYCSHPFPTMVV